MIAFHQLAASVACQCPPWHCQCDQVPPQAAAGHSVWECVGNCKIHTLVSGEAGSIWILMNAGFNGIWGRIDGEEEAERLAAETPEQKAARLAELARMDAVTKAEIEATKVHRKEEKWCAKDGAMKFRVPRPCKYATLFEKRICAGCGTKLPAGSDVCAAIKPATATTRQRVCGETLAGCWNHEQTRTCIYVHPDEKQWADACSGALCYDRQRQCFHLQGEGPASAPSAPSRFAALVGPPRPHGAGGAAPWAQQQRHGPRQEAPKPAAVAAPKPSADGWTSVAPKRAAPPKDQASRWVYGRLRPGGKFDNSEDESEARSEWIEGQKDKASGKDAW